jgi:hypothetical protein
MRISLVALIGGVLCAFCAYKDYNWFMNNYKSRMAVWLFGRSGARIFYIALGAALIFAGLLGLIGAF